MALRSLDNALAATAQERPKRHPKVAMSMQKQSEQVLGGVNDENVAPLPPPPPAAADAAVDYISSENLKPITDPEIKIRGLIEGLGSKDWLKVCEALNNARRFALYHSTLLLPIIDNVMVVLVKAMKNPRSALCKTSIMASSDIFQAFGDNLLDSTTSDAFDNMLLQLLLKASQDKKFVCEEADRALNTMVVSMAPLPLLHKLRASASHANPRIRAKAATSVSHCLSKMEIEGMKEYGLVSLIQKAANLLNDRLPEAREAARSIVTLMYKALTESGEEKQEAWQSFCQSNLPAIDALAIVKIVPKQ